MAREWAPDSWQTFEAKHLPRYESAEALDEATQALSSHPPLVFAGEAKPALLIEELEHSHEVLVVGDDRIGQHLSCLEAGALIVRRIVIQRRVDPLQFGHVVGVGNIHGTQVFRAESGQALLGDGDADFFNGIDMRNLVEDFLLVGVEGEERQILCIEQAQDIFVQVEKNLVEIARGVDLTRDPFDMFREFDFLLQFLQVLRLRFGLHPELL